MLIDARGESRHLERERRLQELKTVTGVRTGGGRHEQKAKRCLVGVRQT
ncbi:MAG: hypothetical protein ABI895_28305 [Deltaproteobacteria bacterium]